MSEYEKLREQNIRRNQEILRQLGLLEEKQQPQLQQPQPQPQQQQPTQILINSIQNSTILFQCNQCFRLLSDNRFLVSSSTDEITHFINVSNVSIDDFIAISNDGCLYSDVECLCGVVLGRYLLATTPSLDHLRFMFCLKSTLIYQYQCEDREDRSEIDRNLSLLSLQEMHRQSNSSMIQLMIADDDLDLIYASLTIEGKQKEQQKEQQQQEQFNSSFSESSEFRI